MSQSFNPDLPYQPFELVALEAALKEVCSSYSTKAKQLEATINPVCESLLKKACPRTPAGHPPPPNLVPAPSAPAHVHILVGSRECSSSLPLANAPDGLTQSTCCLRA